MEAGVNRQTGFAAAACSHQSTFLLGMAAQKGTVLSLVSLLSATILSTVPMKQPVRCLAWSPVEDFLAAGTDSTILLFHAGQEGFLGEPQRLTGGTRNVRSLSFSNDGKVLAACDDDGRSEEHTSELQSHSFISYAVFCLKKK